MDKSPAETPSEAPARPAIEPCTIVIFGAAGELARRKLMPSIFHLFRGEHLHPKTIFVGVDRVEMTEDAFRKEVTKGHARAPGFKTMMLPKVKDWDDFTRQIFYFKGDITSETSMRDLSALLEKLESAQGQPKRRIFYMSLPPAIFGNGLKRLEGAGMVGKGAQGEGQWARVIVEKPFGRDLESSRVFNAAVREVLDERDTYRIDHYLGKETVQNVLFFRFANAIFEPLWNHKYIDHIQITAAETTGLDNRAGYYESTGCLRDMIQNHILQLLALIAMEPPVAFDAACIRDEKLKVVRCLRPIAAADAARETVRGQYASGRIGRNEVHAYRDEEGADPKSMTETYASVRAYIDNWRWAGVPFYLRSGKRMARNNTSIVVTFKNAPHVMFKDLQTPPAPNQLVLQIQPNDGVALQFETKVPGVDNSIKTVNMNFRYPEAFTDENPSSYERLLVDCILGDQTLFIRDDEVEAAWRFITPILQGWNDEATPTIYNYKAGSWGPLQSDEWILSHGREWRNT